MPEVSIIIPNFNHASFLKQRIDSILYQVFQDFELIILDDCSVDESKSIIESYRNHPKVSHIFYNEINSGSPFVQWKKGISASLGKYIWIAESDDFADSNFLEVGISQLKRSGSQLFYCKSVQVNSEGKYLRDLNWWLQDLSDSKWEKNYVNKAQIEIRQFLIWKNFICNASSVIFQKNDKLDGYLENIKSFKFAGDWLFWIQYLKDSEFICYSVDTTNYWRDHSSTTRSFIAYQRNSEIMKIYRWLVLNILHRENLKLLQYYYKFHINKKPRKNLLMHARFIINGFRFSKFTPWLVFKFYLTPKKYEI
jgi:glycosyltransferase involved in cell wall biosynthesis